MGLGTPTNVEWTPFEVQDPDGPIGCNYCRHVDSGPVTSLAIMPTYSWAVRVDLEPEVRTNIMMKWIDALTLAGAGVVLMDGVDDLWTLARWATSGKDGFAWLTRRIGAVMEESVRRGFCSPDKVFIMGTSRHGYASLHALANLPQLAGAVAVQPIIWWPNLEEFLGMEENAVVRRNDLLLMVEDFAPRPLLVQTGYNDRRAGQKWFGRLLAPVAEAYRRTEAAEQFTHEVMPIRGHGGERMPETYLERVVPWLLDRGLV
jgi:hypothetical protein